jgi:glycosyltransferase involved in cell wall biosynthesis
MAGVSVLTYDNPRRKRILFVVNAAWFFVSHRLALGLKAAEEGFEVHVAAPSGSGEQEVIARGFHFHSLRLSRGGTNPSEVVPSIVDLVRLYRWIRPQIVHHVTIKPVLYGSVAAGVCRVPVVINAVTGLGSLFLARGVGATLARFLFRSLLRVSVWVSQAWFIFQNADDLEEYASLRIVSRDRSVIIPGSGVSLSEFSQTPFPAFPPVVMLPARLLGDKGVREFVEAARILRTSRECARFVLVGDTDLDNPSAIPQSEIEGWVASGVVEWWGPQRDMARTLSSSHIVCLPSYREGMPRVLLEAAACGRPIVTTDVPGCRDVVGDSKCGLLVPAKDPALLAAAVQRLLSCEMTLLEMGEAARARAEEAFDISLVLDKTFAVYDLASR